MGHWANRIWGIGIGVRGKGERLNLFLFPLTINLFPCLKSLLSPHFLI